MCRLTENAHPLHPFGRRISPRSPKFGVKIRRGLVRKIYLASFSAAYSTGNASDCARVQLTTRNLLLFSFCPHIADESHCPNSRTCHSIEIGKTVKFDKLLRTRHANETWADFHHLSLRLANTSHVQLNIRNTIGEFGLIVNESLISISLC